MPGPTEAQVLAVRQYFANIGLWKRRFELDPQGWLENFDEADRDLAVALLDGFVYLESRMLRKLFHIGFARLESNRQEDEGQSSDGASSWDELLSDALFSFPTTNATDSGHLFVRYIRDDFGVAEGRIATLPETVERLRTANEPVPIVIVDDFAGSGDQFMRAIRRSWISGDDTSSLLYQIDRLSIDRLYFVAPVVTHLAKSRIEQEGPFLVSAGNVLEATASLRAPNTHLVAESLRTDVRNLVERYSRIAGIPPTKTWGWKRSALAIAFEHSTPNNTLPIFTWKEQGWTPLIRS